MQKRKRSWLLEVSVATIAESQDEKNLNFIIVDAILCPLIITLKDINQYINTLLLIHYFFSMKKKLIQVDMGKQRFTSLSLLSNVHFIIEN